MKTIAEIVVDFPHTGQSPMFDLKLPRGAIFRIAWPWVEKSKLAGGATKVSTRVLFAIDENEPLEPRRFTLMTVNGMIPEELAPHVKHCFSFVTPQGEPISIYEFPPFIVGIDDQDPANSDADAIAAGVMPQTRTSLRSMPDVEGALLSGGAPTGGES